MAIEEQQFEIDMINTWIEACFLACSLTLLPEYYLFYLNDQPRHYCTFLLHRFNGLDQILNQNQADWFPSFIEAGVLRVVMKQSYFGLSGTELEEVFDVC